MRPALRRTSAQGLLLEDLPAKGPALRWVPAQGLLLEDLPVMGPALHWPTAQGLLLRRPPSPALPTLHPSLHHPHPCVRIQSAGVSDVSD